MTARLSSSRAVARMFSPLALFRMARRLRQADVSRRGGLPSRTVSAIETGVQPANDEHLRKLCRGLRAKRSDVTRLLSQTRKWASRS